ncbi:hypothetical protein LX16_3247 [Stackebrandtia albiflava]|uniref:WD40 repeat protein n=1 Tax=Stackebrandtia albiflava TaxID=406432 RepID=A0A562V3L0_9ACTN|nr:hypothetical protein LX16_3247 [Stackebrandtia albiflava]
MVEHSTPTRRIGAALAACLAAVSLTACGADPSESVHALSWASEDTYYYLDRPILWEPGYRTIEATPELYLASPDDPRQPVDDTLGIPCGPSSTVQVLSGDTVFVSGWCSYLESDRFITARLDVTTGRAVPVFDWEYRYRVVTTWTGGDGDGWVSYGEEDGCAGVARVEDGRLVPWHWAGDPDMVVAEEPGTGEYGCWYGVRVGDVAASHDGTDVVFLAESGLLHADGAPDSDEWSLYLISGDLATIEWPLGAVSPYDPMWCDDVVFMIVRDDTGESALWRLDPATGAFARFRDDVGSAACSPSGERIAVQPESGSIEILSLTGE